MIILTKEAYFKLKHFILNVDGEISGLGKSKIIGNEDILVKDIEIFSQQSSAGSTHLQEEALAKFLNYKMLKGEDISKWNIWWHSHSEMDAFWSSTDENTIETFTGGEFFISMVVNKSMEMLGRMDIFRPFRFVFGLQVVKPRGLSKKGQEKRIKNYCKRKIKKCLKQPTGFFGRHESLTPKNSKKQSQLSEREILEAMFPMG